MGRMSLAEAPLTRRSRSSPQAALTIFRSDDPLPDSLTGLLTATPYSYNITAPASHHAGRRQVRRGRRTRARRTTFIFRTRGKPRRDLSVSYGLRYEVNSRIHEATKRTSLPMFTDAEGKPTGYRNRNAKQEMLINPQPPYDQDWNGWGPRLGVDYAAEQAHRVARRRGALLSLIPNLWQDNFLTAGIPFVFCAVYHRLCRESLLRFRTRSCR